MCSWWSLNDTCMLKPGCYVFLFQEHRTTPMGPIKLRKEFRPDSDWGVLLGQCHQQQFRGAILNVSWIEYDYRLPLLVITGNITSNITDYTDNADGQLKLLPLLPSFSNIYYLFHFCHIINYISSVFVINSLLLFSGNITRTRQKNSKGPGGACVCRRGRRCATAQWHNGQSKPDFARGDYRPCMFSVGGIPSSVSTQNQTRN